MLLKTFNSRGSYLNMLCQTMDARNSKTNSISFCANWGRFHQHGFTLIPAWISSYIRHNVWDEITYPWKWIDTFISRFIIMLQSNEHDEALI